MQCFLIRPHEKLPPCDAPEIRRCGFQPPAIQYRAQSYREVVIAFAMVCLFRVLNSKRRNNCDLNTNHFVVRGMQCTVELCKVHRCGFLNCHWRLFGSFVLLCFVVSSGCGRLSFNFFLVALSVFLFFLRSGVALHRPHHHVFGHFLIWSPSDTKSVFNQPFF